MDRFVDRRIWLQTAQGLRTLAIKWADSRISKSQRIANQRRILARIPDSHIPDSNNNNNNNHFICIPIYIDGIAF